MGSDVHVAAIQASGTLDCVSRSSHRFDPERSDPPPPEVSDAPSPRDDTAVVPSIPEDEGDVGWGDPPDAGTRDDDWYEDERPPHHE